ncbi:Phage repressor protein C, contains Cro/C1-type HTH and peptisase s24 domains [Pararobbsia alpina]|uniref:LexA family transcriptional regulator n=1 Tax=Pararobbsia alpina TaxID=621374 RepID=UPI0039A61627
MSTLSERIQQVLTETGVDQVQLGQAAGVTKGTVNQWLTGAIKSIKLEYAVGIQEKFGYNPVWLVMDKGNPKVPGIHHTDPFEPIPLPARTRIPVVGLAQLGDNGFWADVEYAVGQGDGYIDFPSRDREAYGIKCKGDSMLPRIRDGEFVVVEPNHEIDNGDEVLVKASDGRVMVKIFLYSRAGRVHLQSVNREHGDIAIDKDKIDRMHFVAAIVKPSFWKPE